MRPAGVSIDTGCPICLLQVTRMQRPVYADHRSVTVVDAIDRSANERLANGVAQLAMYCCNCAISTCWSSIIARIRSPIDTMPMTASTSSTGRRSEEHTSELQSLMRISYAVFCLKKKKHPNTSTPYPPKL